MTRYADNDPRALLGDEPSGDRYGSKKPPAAPRGKPRSTGGTGSTRQTRATARRSDEETVRQVRDGKPQNKASSGLYDTLAEQFLSQDWIATHRGNTATVPTIEVGDTGRPLIAKILRDKVASEKRFEGRDDEKIAEVVEYAMKHFFDRLDNDLRRGRLVNQFVSSDWWDTLIPEAIDHWHAVRIPPEVFERGRQEAEAFYAAWPTRDARPARPTNPREAAERFEQILAANRPNYDDCEPLT
ncbi:hypothetical protein [Terracoccus sp. 273MFTsu3.1]|uniref:hypothetical protein n=1 Tax=Terracoccus sp. 273MFTsu3.1 TaxID=1172188 RepID=UPI00037F3465|nr:hypothetical protein [Terracoccus sp. 273MFTsu3.1]